MTIDLPLDSEDVNAILKVVIANENLVNPHVLFKTGSKIGDGFLGIDTAVEITSDGDKRLDLFVKTAPKQEKFREVMHIRVAYCNEYKFYQEIYPRLDALYVEKVGESLGVIPKYYAGSIEEEKEILVLENLKVKVFELNGVKKTFDAEQILALLNTYGKLHAASLAFKDQYTEIFDQITKDIPDFFSLMFQSPEMRSAFPKICSIITKHLHPVDDKILLEKVNRFLDEYDDTLTRIKEFQSPYSVVVHGDCNNNNIMFRKKEKKDDPLELRLIDFQGTRLTSPMWDISYFFYTSASSEEHLAKLDSYLDTYYEILSATVKKLGSDPEQLYPKHLMQEQWTLFSKFSFIMAVIIISRVCEEEVPNIVDMIENPTPETEEMKLDKEELYMKNVRPLLQHFLDRGLL